ncbi:helix-turn-helix transcriptional regulator [Dysgonomonas sp. Marseille-P4677]|uniref:winged helix-turn-helix transcriptional regulator n=1 Tax=Dysgonomonas sp. Marseille-P4677 TaxID=2364790 RepID=UPI0019113841|nr:helix-turn-helix domain-containing protein [Dysgonomonas sp. Marseille-P4677]MBK5720740.1 helix-turn-helix transcriptional regulator [Dysgonomonas sp. Marseille-P4677]
MNNNPDLAVCNQNLLAMRDTLDILGGKWKLQILHYLTANENNDNTFKKIERGISGISAKMLSKELKDLEQNELVSRKVISGKPVTVEYAITEYGKSTGIITQKLVDWGITHRKRILGK